MTSRKKIKLVHLESEPFAEMLASIPAWERVEISHPALPDVVRALPRDRFYAAFVSGKRAEQRSEKVRHHGVETVTFSLDIFRYDEKDEPPLNLDEYKIVETKDGTFLLRGPSHKPGDHWYAEVPDEVLDDVTIYLTGSQG